MAIIIDVTGQANAGLKAAASALAKGGLVAVPTETVYGLAADATFDDAVARIFAVKGRPDFNPLISHVANTDMARRYGKLNGLAEKLVSAFWPGPLTLVVPQAKGSTISPMVTAGMKTIALRQPHGLMAQISAKLDLPLAAPSANTSGRLSPTLAQHVADDLGNEIDVILDGGGCSVGVESTIIQVDDQNFTLLREGGIPRELIESVAEIDLPATTEGKIIAPGMMLAHYAPIKPVALDVVNPPADAAILAFGAQSTGQSQSATLLNLSPSGNLSEAARNLYAMLAELDGTEASLIAVQPIPKDGLGAAINDRLMRAASGKNA